MFVLATQVCKTQTIFSFKKTKSRYYNISFALFRLGIYGGYHGYASPYVAAPAYGHAAIAPYAHAVAPALAPAYARPVAAAVPGVGLLGRFHFVHIRKNRTEISY